MPMRALLICMAVAALSRGALLAQPSRPAYRLVELSSPAPKLTAPAYVVRDTSGTLTVLFTGPVGIVELATADAIVRTMQARSWPQGRAAIATIKRLPMVPAPPNTSAHRLEIERLNRQPRGDIRGFGRGRWMDVSTRSGGRG
jgi:hypothetical protein